MRASTWIARIITSVIALIVTPIALGMVATGGMQWRFAVMAGAYPGFEGPSLAVPVLQIAGGVLLLMAVVFTGIWSSAGLLTAGVLSLAPLVLASAPALMMGLYRLLNGAIPREWLDGLLMGIPLLLLPVLGGLGIALMMLRRHPVRCRGQAM